MEASLRLTDVAASFNNVKMVLLQRLMAAHKYAPEDFNLRQRAVQNSFPNVAMAATPLYWAVLNDV